MNNSTFLVLGANGKTGSRIAQRLTEQGRSVRRGSRQATPAFDWNGPSGWSAALDGVSAAYICYVPDLAIDGAANSIRDFVEQAVAHGLKRLVLLSGRGEEEAQRCERILQAADVEWTVLRASWFNQNFSEGAFLEMVLAGEIALPAGQIGEPFIDVDDIADVAVAALTEEGHAGQIYELTGPRLLTFAEVTEEIAKGVGREIEYIQLPMDVFEQGVAEANLPADIAWLTVYLFTTVFDGRNASVGDGIQRALGREPRDFSEYVRRTAEAGMWEKQQSEVR
ncbi:MAG: hypothetical protein ACI8TQ_003191 [Planctomycetota bacterium]|jgi:uncharacterized protein YbjT (DUF2867 family)